YAAGKREQCYFDVVKSDIQKHHQRRHRFINPKRIALSDRLFGTIHIGIAENAAHDVDVPIGREVTNESENAKKQKCKEQGFALAIKNCGQFAGPESEEAVRFFFFIVVNG